MVPCLSLSADLNFSNIFYYVYVYVYVAVVTFEMEYGKSSIIPYMYDINKVSEEMVCGFFV